MEALILCVMLGSPYFPVRHNADVALRSLGDSAIPVLELHANSRDPEVRRRVDAILASHRHEGITAILAAHQPMPWIDAMPDDTEGRRDIICHYLELARGAAGMGVGWPDWRLATHLWMADQAAAGVPLADLKRLLSRMTKRCQGWDGSGSAPVEVPERLAMPRELE